MKAKPWRKTQKSDGGVKAWRGVQTEWHAAYLCCFSLCLRTKLSGKEERVEIVHGVGYHLLEKYPLPGRPFAFARSRAVARLRH